MSLLLRDLAYSFRRQLHAPVATFVALLSLSLALGAQSVLFSVIRGVLLQPLPFPNAGSLVIVTENNRRTGGKDLQPSVPTFQDWQQRSHGFASLAGALPTVATLRAGDEPEVVKVTLVSPGFFRTLGVRPVAGRDLMRAEDERAQPAAEAILSYDLWQGRFGRSRSVIGRVIDLGETPVTIVGVAPPRVTTPGGTRIWVPLALAPRLFPNLPDVLTNRKQRLLHVIGRLAGSTAVTLARRDLETIERQLAADFPKIYRDSGIDLVPLRERAVRGVRPSLLLLQAAVVLVLLIAGMNLANLLLARALERESDLAVRVALGVNRRRLFQQTAVESLLLTIGGGLAGSLLSFWALRVILRLAPSSLPYANQITVNGTVLVVNLSVSFALGLAAGLVPAARVIGLGRAGASIRSLSASAHQRWATGQSLRLQAVLVAVETCFAVLLLIVCGLLVRSFQALQRVDPGFDPHHVLALSVSLPASEYREPARVAAFYRNSLDNLAALPGVTAVAAASDAPLEGTSDSAALTRPAAAGDGSTLDAELTIDCLPVSTGYFRTLRVPLLRGRDFTAHDLSPSPRVLIVNRSLAEVLWPGQDAVGRLLIRDHNTTVEVVGVVEDVTCALAVVARRDLRAALGLMEGATAGAGGGRLAVVGVVVGAAGGVVPRGGSNAADGGDGGGGADGAEGGGGAGGAREGGAAGLRSWRPLVVGVGGPGDAGRDQDAGVGGQGGRRVAVSGPGGPAGGVETRSAGRAGGGLAGSGRRGRRLREPEEARAGLVVAALDLAEPSPAPEVDPLAEGEAGGVAAPDDEAGRLVDEDRDGGRGGEVAGIAGKGDPEDGGAGRKGGRERQEGGRGTGGVGGGGGGDRAEGEGDGPAGERGVALRVGEHGGDGLRLAGGDRGDGRDRGASGKGREGGESGRAGIGEGGLLAVEGEEDGGG
ncbi:MAG: ABC transporter permease [Acidobacteriota bacterium]|nr:ABC transporter permease [Acidobacteriota bacterium]